MRPMKRRAVLHQSSPSHSVLASTFDVDSPGGSKVGRELSARFTDEKTEALRMNKTEGHAIGSWAQNTRPLAVFVHDLAVYKRVKWSDFPPRTQGSMGRGRKPILCLRWPLRTGSCEAGVRPALGSLRGWGLGALGHSLFGPAFGRLVKILESELHAAVDKLLPLSAPWFPKNKEGTK